MTCFYDVTSQSYVVNGVSFKNFFEAKEYIEQEFQAANDRVQA